MGVNSLPKTVTRHTRQRRGCDLNPGPSAPESSTLTTRLPSRPPSCSIPTHKALWLWLMTSYDGQTETLLQLGSEWRPCHKAEQMQWFIKPRARTWNKAKDWTFKAKDLKIVLKDSLRLRTPITDDIPETKKNWQAISQVSLIILWSLKCQIDC